MAFCSAVEMGESKDLQKFLNGHIVDFSLKDRAIGGYRQWQTLRHLPLFISPLPLFISLDSFLLHLLLSSGYQAVAILSIFMEFVIEF